MAINITLTRRPAETGPFVPSAPRVNLVPPAALERRANRRARSRSIVLWVASVLAVAALWTNGTISQANMKVDLQAARSEGETLATQLARYAPVTSIAAQTKALNDTVASQTTNEVDHAAVIEHFNHDVEGLLAVSSLTIGTDSTTGCVSTDPFADVPLAGCITFTGEGAGSTGAAQVIAALTDDPWFHDPFIPSVADAKDGSATLSGTVGLTMEAYVAFANSGDPSASSTPSGSGADTTTETGN